MHVAYDLSQLLKLTVQVESIAAFDDNLFVGTRVGHLLIYNVTKRAGDLKHEVQLLTYNKHFSKKPVQQLDVIPAYQTLVSLTDGIVSFHNFYKVSATASLNVNPLPKTRGATFFTIDIAHNESLTGESCLIVRLCVVLKRKIQLYYWKDGSFHELQSEITAPDVPRSAMLCMDTIILGFKSEYSIYKISENVFTKLFLIGSAPEPIITKIDKDSVALEKDSQSILINSKGATTTKHRISWTELPSLVICDKPFLIGLLPEAVEIRCVEPNMLIQKLPCQKGIMATRARPGTMFLANGSLVWCLQAVGVHHQIKSLLSDQQFELALRVAEDCEYERKDEKEKTVHEVHTLYAYHLFATKQFKESMSQFFKLKTKPQDVIKLFPDLLPASAAKTTQPKLTDKELEEGLSALVDYLADLRWQQKGLPNVKSSVLSIIDTTLLKCYIQINDALIAPLLRRNTVHFQEAEQVLKKHNKLSELVILYHTNELHSKALALHKQLNNIKGTVEYLQHLGPKNLTLLMDYAEWVFQENPQEGLKIFIEDTVEVEMLPRPQILTFILRTQKDLAIPYLEHAIKFWNDTNPILHTSLANLYREKYLILKEMPECRQEALKLREKLAEFLEQSEHYTPQTILDLFPKDDLLVERAIMLGKQGRHEQALSIYVCLLEDIPKARLYCERVWASKAPGHDEVYVLLMQILLSPPENWLVDVVKPSVLRPPDSATAMDILRSNPTKIDPAQALAVLPDTVSIREIKSFLASSIRNKLAQRRETQIVRGLVYSNYLQIQDQRMRCEARPIVVTDLHVCVICSKRFTNQSVFALVPAGVVHYGCLKEKSTN